MRSCVGFTDGHVITSEKISMFVWRDWGKPRRTSFRVGNIWNIV